MEEGFCFDKEGECSPGIRRDPNPPLGWLSETPRQAAITQKGATSANDAARKVPKRSKRFEKRRAPPCRRNRQRKKATKKSRRLLISWKRQHDECKGQDWMEKLNRQREWLSSSWLLSFFSNDKSPSCQHRESLGLQSKVPFPSPDLEAQPVRETKRVAYRGVRGKRDVECATCDWVENRRVVPTWARRKRGVMRTRWRQWRRKGWHREKRTSRRTSAGNSMSYTPLRLLSCTLLSIPRKGLDRSDGRSVDVSSWGGLYVSNISYPLDVPELRFLDFEGRDEGGYASRCENGSVSAEDPSKTSRGPVCYNREFILGTSKLQHARHSEWVGDQLGKRYSSNDSGDGPASGVVESSGRIHETDLRFLLTFYGTSCGSLWPRSLRWDLEADPIAWHGVHLGSDGRVVEISVNFDNQVMRRLHGVRVYGSITPDLSRLDRLTKIHLTNMRLEGRIPEELSRLEELRELVLSGNRLTGSIPVQLASLRQLKVFDLCFNKLTGVIPTELSMMVELQQLLLVENKLTGRIPAELSVMTQLQELGLSANQLTGSIPAELSGLQRLKELLLGCNQLSGNIPMELSMLRDLEMLHVGGNQLTGPIPVELSKLRWLKTLYLHKNRFTGGIPPEFSALQELRALTLFSNQLKGSIPAELSNLQQLRELDLRGNQLTGTIPHEFYRLESLETFKAYNNKLTGLWDHQEASELEDVFVEGVVLPYRLARFLDWLTALGEKRGHSDAALPELLPNGCFREPPEAVASRGMTAVRAYFHEVFKERYISERRDLKAVIIGETGAGKTSLRQSIRDGKPSPTRDGGESTVHLDIDSVELDGMLVSLFDCAGQEAYYGLLQNFITERAVYLVVCDMSRFASPRNNDDFDQLDADIQRLEELGVCGWFRCLSWRVPGCDVILVGTKCDLVGEDAMMDIGQRMEIACQKWLEMWADIGRKINIEPGVSLTSCKKDWKRELKGDWWQRKRDWGCDRWNDYHGASSLSLLYRITHKSEGGDCRGTTMTIPRGWFIALSVLETLADRRDPVHWVLQRLRMGNDGRRVQDEAPGAGGEESVITLENLKKYCRDVFKTLEHEHCIQIADHDRALEGALLIREFEGRILRQGSYLFSDVVWLAVILKPILTHKERRQWNGDIRLEVGKTKPIVLSTKAQKNAWRRLTEKGFLDIELAHTLWSGDLSQYVLPILQDIDLAFQHPTYDSTFVVMLQLPRCRPPIVDETLVCFRRDHYPTLEGSWRMILGAPPGMIEKVLTRCCSLGSTNIFWRFGVLVTGDFGSAVRGRFALVLEYVNDEFKLEVHGNQESVGPWMALSYALSTLLSKAWEYPGLKWEASLGCPTHGSGTLRVSDEARHPKEKLIAEGGCEACSRETKEAGAFAEELLLVVNVREPREVAASQGKIPAGFVCSPEHQASPEAHQYEGNRSGYFSRLVRIHSTPFPGRLPLASRNHERILEAVERTFLELRVHYLEPTMEDAQTRHVTPFETLQEIARDVQDTVARVRNPRDVGENEGEDAHPMRGNLTPTEAFVSQLTNMDAAVQRFGVGLQRVETICRAVQVQGDESRAMLGFVKDMTKAMRAERFETPRFACLLIPWEFQQSRGLSPREQDPRTWLHKLEISTRKKGWFTKEMRLFLVCARTLRLVPSGPEGHGYSIKEVRQWVKRTTGMMKMMLQLSSVALGAATAAGLASNFLVAMGAAQDIIQNEGLLGLKVSFEAQIRMGQMGETERLKKIYPQKTVEPLGGKAYESLKEFIGEQEDGALANMVRDKRKARRRGFAPPEPTFVFFEDLMKKEQDDRNSGEVHWIFRDCAA